MVLLTAENIRKSYGTRVIFDDISFSIHEGDKIGVVGVNGTGKSTLLKIVAGVNQADSGEFPIVKDTTPNITNSRLNNIP